MTSPRMQLKESIIALLDQVGREHPSGHQPSKARRYLVAADGGMPVEVMFEKNEATAVNIWCPAGVAALMPNLASKAYPKSDLWTKKNEHGELLYGRHSGLQSMPQLAEADLAKFQPQTLEQARKVIDAIVAYSLKPAI